MMSIGCQGPRKKVEEHGDFGMRTGGHGDVMAVIGVNMDEAQGHRKALGFKLIQGIIQC
jgi:hypothetical protein